MAAQQNWIAAAMLALGVAGLAAPASAHPHVFIEARTKILYDNGTFTGVEHRWTFDEFYTQTAIEGLDANKDGVYSREELAELAKVNIEGLKEFSYFTYPKLAGKDVTFSDVKGLLARAQGRRPHDGVHAAVCEGGAGQGAGLQTLGRRSDVLHRLRLGQGRGRHIQRERAEKLHHHHAQVRG